MIKYFLVLVVFCFCLNAQNLATWHTSMGDFTAELREDLVPITANNFADLALSNFYNNLIFHRVIDDFMIQDGCPNGNGTGGPGYTIPDEFHPDLLHDSEGVLSMANAGPNTGGSQYFITLVPTTWLDYHHAVFGRIIDGIENVQAIGDVETDANDKPIVDVNIFSITMSGIRILDPIEDFQLSRNFKSSFDLSECFQVYSDLTPEYAVVSENSEAVVATVVGNTLYIEAGSSFGNSKIIVTASSENFTRSFEFVASNQSDKPLIGYGNCYSLDGFDDYFDFGNDTSLNEFESFTISMMVKFDEIKSAGLINKGLGPNTGNGWSLELRPSGALKFKLRGEDNSNRSINSNCLVTQGNWYSIAITYDKTFLTIYINGVEDNTISFGTQSGVKEDTNRSLIIGSSVSGFFKGCIDNVSIWNNVPDLDQIWNLASETINHDEPTLVASWLFNEGYGSQTEDIKGVSNGVIENGDNMNWRLNDRGIEYLSLVLPTINSYLPAGSLFEDVAFEIIDNPSHGSFEQINLSTGEFEYTISDYHETDSFSYRLNYLDGTSSDIMNCEINFVTLGADDVVNPEVNIIKAYPNPFNPVCIIVFTSNKENFGDLKIINRNGETVLSENIRIDKGENNISFNGKNLSSGVYFVKLNIDGREHIVKTILMK
ncbi:MAG: peptidylprolyl isomerase [Candidatus Delongbacteria bacterium]|nr:peptidylprolyl isomerase [Candidatus Delongbacteria bacterium]MBN2836197.1 peptidylprolyl isomerase [Candidatus Delongbacteria bacterium]